jgi:hypothetical protein
MVHDLPVAYVLPEAARHNSNSRFDHLRFKNQAVLYRVVPERLPQVDSFTDDLES